MWSLYIHGHFMPMGDLDLDLWGQIFYFARFFLLGLAHVCLTTW